VAVKQEFEAMNPKRDDKNRGKRDHKQFPHLVTCDSRSRLSFLFFSKRIKLVTISNYNN
jgi:hypothetical protein